MRYFFICILLFLVLISTTQNTRASIFRYSKGTKIAGHHTGFNLDIDLAKSYLQLYTNITAVQPVERKLGKDLRYSAELKFYGSLLKGSLLPNYLMVEFNYHVLTNAGVYAKNKHPDFYQNADIDLNIDDTKVNLIQLMASRYEKPYSFSVFLGDITPFFSSMKKNRRKQMGPPTQTGSAVMGHVITWGNRRLIKLDEKSDSWFQYAFMIKGTNKTKERQKKWHFMIGHIFHQNEFFINAFTFKLVRDYASRTSKRMLDNIKIEYSFNIPSEKINKEINKDLKVNYWTTFQKIIFGKNYHFKNFVLGIEAGVKWEIFKDENRSAFSETTFIIAPNLSW